MIRMVDEMVLEMASRRGFVEAFWRTLREMRETDPAVTQRRVFERLSGICEGTFGSRPFRTFDAFRVWRDRHR